MEKIEISNRISIEPDRNGGIIIHADDHPIVTMTKSDVRGLREAVSWLYVDGRVDTWGKQATLAYLAGILDGEGCISILKRKSEKPKEGQCHYDLRVTIGMADRNPPQMFAKIFGGKTYYADGPYNIKTNARPMWLYRASNKRGEQILTDLLPFLTVKKPQALLALEFKKFKETIKDRSKYEPFYQKFRHLNRRGRKAHDID